MYKLFSSIFNKLYKLLFDTIDMRENIFRAIEAKESLGIESMLRAASKVAWNNKDYETFFDTERFLAYMNLGIKINLAGDETKCSEDQKSQLIKREKVIHARIADALIKEKKFLKAAKTLEAIGKHRKAITMYEADGSKAAIHEAALIRIQENIKPLSGLEYFVGENTIGEAFSRLRRIKYPLSPEKMQSLGEYLVKELYTNILTKTRKKYSTPKNNLHSKSLIEILESVNLPYLEGEQNFDPGFESSLKYIMPSKDPEVITAGIAFIHYLSIFSEHTRDAERYKRDLIGYRPMELSLRIKLDPKEKYITEMKAIAREVKATSHSPTLNEPATLLMDALIFHKKYEQALIVADEFLHPNDYMRIGLLYELKMTDEILRTSKEHNSPITYAYTLARRVKHKN